MILSFTSLVQHIAKPPLLLLLDKEQSTEKVLEKQLPKELVFAESSELWSLVSIRKTISG
jgi:hypothetical protein